MLQTLQGANTSGRISSVFSSVFHISAKKCLENLSKKGARSEAYCTVCMQKVTRLNSNTALQNNLLLGGGDADL